MTKLSKASFENAASFVQKNARALDLAIFNFHFAEGTIEEVFEELQKFQNADGGFGHGLEPDFKTPTSSNMATTFAFQYLANLDALPDYMQNAINFFSENFSEEYQRWLPTPPDVNDHPHAIWWQYDTNKLGSDESWGNPTVEIIGYLLRHSNGFAPELLLQLKKQAINRLLGSESMEFHEVYCYLRFRESLEGDELEQVTDQLKTILANTIETDTSKWDGYVAKPLGFVNSPHSPYYHDYEQAIQVQLDNTIEGQSDDGAWYPSWEWPDYPEVWTETKVELAGQITVNTLKTLKTFGRLEN